MTKKKSPKNKIKRSGKKKTLAKNSKDRIHQKEILAFLKAHRQDSFTSKQVGAATGLYAEVGINKVRSLMDGLTQSGKIEYLDKGKYRYMKQTDFKTGQIEVTRSGVGFVLQEGSDDIFVNQSSMGKAFHGDLVKVQLKATRKRGGRPEGEVVEVLSRARTEFVGVIEEGLPGTFFFLPDNPRISSDFYVRKQHLNGAKDGEKVLLKFLNWDRQSPEGEVLQILGEAGEHNTEMHAILLQYGFDPSFPPEVEEEVRHIAEKISTKEVARRRDMRGVPTFTIDPEDAKDFDDALSFQVLENGRIEVGIHIADVSHYVKPGTLLDKEAFRRATSVYLVDRTVPMLPEKLSNHLCSLRPREDKLTYSAIFEMDDAAHVYHYWIGRTVIHSDQRFTYEEAQALIVDAADHELKGPVVQLNELAKKLRAHRMKLGSIEFESEEVKFELDEHDRPIRVVKKERFDAHKLIEDFMLLANRTVAKHLHDLRKNPPLPAVYRIHDRPDPEKLSHLQEFVGHFGYRVNLQSTPDTAGMLNQLLAEVIDKPEQNVIETLAIRSMAKAVYSTHNIGHFGLGFPFYTHFTSPIRRYPDLMVHRLITKYHNQEFNEDPEVMEAMCNHCSGRERTATEAERESIKYKQVEFLEDRVGQSFTGIISGVIEAGIFVELDESLCEGFVPARTMEDDYYAFDSDAYALVGTQKGKILRLGDPVEVEIAGTDMKRRTVDMLLVRTLSVEQVA